MQTKVPGLQSTVLKEANPIGKMYVQSNITDIDFGLMYKNSSISSFEGNSKINYMTLHTHTLCP